MLLALLEVKRADTLAHANTPAARERYRAVLAFTALTHQVLREETCFSVKDLDLTGRDLLALGMRPGPAVGQMLQRLLEDVWEERCPNRRQDLLAQAQKGLEHAD